MAARKQRQSLLAGWVVVILTCSGFLGLLLAVLLSRHPSAGGTLFGVLFAGFGLLFGLTMLPPLLQRTAEARRFGVISLTPSPEKVIPGGKFKAILTFHDRTPPLAAVDVELRCLRIGVFHARQGNGETEEPVWSTRSSVPLRGNSAAIVVDIPADARATDLPGERPGENAYQSMSIPPGVTLRFHRWEMRITAALPEVSLDRWFPVIVDPDPRAGANPMAAFAAMPPPESTWRKLIVVGPMAVLVLGLTVHFHFKLQEDSEAPPQAVAGIAAAPAAPGGTLPAQTSWTTPTEGWTLPMPAFSRHVGIAANGIHATREANGVRFVFDEIVIERNPAWPRIDYADLRFTVRYQPASAAGAAKEASLSARLADVRGSLAAGTQALTLHGLAATVPLPQARGGQVAIHLTVDAAPDGAKPSPQRGHELVMGGL